MVKSFGRSRQTALPPMLQVLARGPTQTTSAQWRRLHRLEASQSTHRELFMSLTFGICASASSTLLLQEARATQFGTTSQLHMSRATRMCAPMLTAFLLPNFPPRASLRPRQEERLRLGVSQRRVAEERFRASCRNCASTTEHSIPMKFLVCPSRRFTTRMPSSHSLHRWHRPTLSLVSMDFGGRKQRLFAHQLTEAGPGSVDKRQTANRLTVPRVQPAHLGPPRSRLRVAFARVRLAQLALIPLRRGRPLALARRARRARLAPLGERAL
jgi:hypothetical protein